MAKIKFLALNEEVLNDFPYPQPSNKFVPDWYNKMPSFTTNEKIISDEGNINGTLKLCIPFRDAMLSGYMIPLPFDVYIKRIGKELKINSSYKGHFQLVYDHLPEQFFMYPIPDGYEYVALKWNNPWMIKTPRGWSTLFTTPIHHDLPFKNLEGIVDTDKHPLPVAIVFFIKKDFEGIIKKGTPIVQCIPIKRQNFVGYIGQMTDMLLYKWRKVSTQVMNRYRDHFHSPKSFKMEQTESKCPFAKLFKKN